MARFIRLDNIILNTSKIVSIEYIAPRLVNNNHNITLKYQYGIQTDQYDWFFVKKEDSMRFMDDITYRIALSSIDPKRD